MADNVYLLETRLSKAQQAALATIREVARTKGFTVFLVGGAVRDLIGGTAVRDLDVVVQGSAPKLKKELEKAGGVLTGENDPGQALFMRFPGGVRVEIGSTLAVTYPKPGKPVAKLATIQEDLRRRDFTANAMALSLNEGSYGLLMDPLNGVADIENRELRLVSNYGFIEDPVRMIRAVRLGARLGWHMDEKTQARYETGKAEGYISALSEFHRGYETEEVFHEEDALRVMRRLEEEGWMKDLHPALSATKANVPEMERLRESQAQLQIQGVVADSAAANFPFLTAKMAPKEVESLKRSFPRQGFVAEIDALEGKGKEFTAQLGTKGATQPSQAYKLMTSGDPEAVLWAAHTTKSAGLQAKFKSFYTEWPQARQRLPYLLMQEMRITPELPEYAELLDRLFFELMDGRLGTAEEMKAFLEPYSPPAPPPPVSLRRPRAAKKDAKPAKSRKKAVEQTAASAPEGDPVEAAKVPAETAEEPAAPTDETMPPAKASPRTAAPKPQAAKAAPPAKAASATTAVAKSVPGKKIVPGKQVAAKAPAKTPPPAKAAVSEKTPSKKVGQPAGTQAGKGAKAPAGKTAAPKSSAPKKAAPPAKKGPSGKAPGSKSAAKPVPAKKIPAPAKKAAPAKGGVPKKAAGKAPAKKAAAKRR